MADVNDNITSALKMLPLEDIVGAPLSACVKAQEQAAQATWNFIRETGFTSDEDGNLADAVIVSFQFRQNGFVRKMTIPLLVLVPIPYLQIDSVDLAFRADMSATSEGKIIARFAAAGTAEVGQTSKYQVQNRLDINIRASPPGWPRCWTSLVTVASLSKT